MFDEVICLSNDGLQFKNHLNTFQNPLNGIVIIDNIAAC